MTLALAVLPGRSFYSGRARALVRAGLDDPSVGGIFWILGLASLAPAFWPWAQGARASGQPKGLLAALLR